MLPCGSNTSNELGQILAELFLILLDPPIQFKGAGDRFPAPPQAILFTGTVMRQNQTDDSNNP
jgi:hypothetical protein